MALISVKNLCVNSRVKSVSFALQKGEVLGLIGPNGAGKTTLLHSLVGIEQGEGEILLDGKSFDSISPKQRARMIGLQPQTVNSVWSLCVKDVVALGRLPWGDSKTEIIEQAMERTGVTEFSKRSIDRLSGGERARVWLARVLAGQPQVLLVDEPVANLDIHYQLTVMNVLRNWADEDNAVIVALHDLSLAARYCDRLCLMNHGELVAQGKPEEVLTEDQLTTTYGVPVAVDLQRTPPIVQPR